MDEERWARNGTNAFIILTNHVCLLNESLQVGMMTALHRKNLKVVQRADAIQASHTHLEVQIKKVNDELDAIKAKQNTSSKLNIIADTVAAFFNEILDEIDPNRIFKSWKEFMSSEECLNESEAIRKKAKVARYDWYQHADICKYFKWHKKDIKAVITKLPLKSFSVLRVSVF